jgi:hypothetical protein
MPPRARGSSFMAWRFEESRDISTRCLNIGITIHGLLVPHLHSYSNATASVLAWSIPSCTFIDSTALSSRYLCRGASRRAVEYVTSTLACVATIGYVTVEARFQHADVLSAWLWISGNHEKRRQCKHTTTSLIGNIVTNAGKRFLLDSSLQTRKKRYTVSRCNITRTPTGAWNVPPERRSQGWYILRVNVCFQLALGTFDVEEIACS